MAEVDFGWVVVYELVWVSLEISTLAKRRRELFFFFFFSLKIAFRAEIRFR